MPQKQIRATELADILKAAKPLSSGFNTDVYIAGSKVLKVVGAKRPPLTRLVHHLQLTPTKAQWLGQNIAIYNDKLLEVGLLLPQDFEWSTGPSQQNGCHFLLLQQSFIGRDSAKERLKQARNVPEIQKITQTMLLAIEPIFQEGVISRLGIDPLPENFVFRNGDVVYVDIFPPHLPIDGRLLVEYPEPKTATGYSFNHWKYFTPDGVMAVLLSQLARVRPDHFDIFWQEISQWLRELGYQLAADQLSRYVISEAVSAKEVIYSTGNPCQMRLVASQLASRQLIPPEVVEKVYRLTHYEDGDFTPILQAARNILQDAIPKK